MISCFKSRSPDQTIEFGRKISHYLIPGRPVALVGPLGAGKTCLVKGIISEFTGIPTQEITSPTFTIMEEFPGDTSIYHLDLYRIDHPEAAEELPWEELMGPQAITLIEWADKLPHLLKHCYFHINFSRNKENVRTIQFIAREEK